MKPHKQPEQRTFLQDRFEILIKRQKEGTANFNELTELDAMVNADPDLRTIILMEMEGFDEPSGPAGIDKITTARPAIPQTLWNKIRSFFVPVNKILAQQLLIQGKQGFGRISLI